MWLFDFLMWHVNCAGVYASAYASVPLTVTKYGWKNNFKSAGLKKIKEGYATPEAIKRSSTFANLVGGLCSDFQRVLDVALPPLA